jgi:hypothetical protein
MGFSQGRHVLDPKRAESYFDVLAVERGIRRARGTERYDTF